MAKIDGKVALVSGSGRGIGKALALKLASEGARVVVNDLDADVANETVDEIRSVGAEAVAIVGNVAADDFADRFAGAAMDTWGGIDIIVNNAGFTWDSVVQKMTDDQWDAVIDVHIKAPFRILRAAAEPIRIATKREAMKGTEVVRKVVNISSIAGLYGNAGQINYSSAKSAMIGMTRTMAKEWGRYKVTVNCVAFGYIKTRMTQPIEGEKPPTLNIDGKDIRVGVQPHMIQMMEAIIPMGRGGTPEEAANAVYLFCTPESDYISGQVIVAGGGLLI
ncbi:MAG: SDR family oxidoreductase [Rhodospirillaceae bacterium]|nr:SDR family oxidoreductase [Rhodospirillaceae bacterium]